MAACEWCGKPAVCSNCKGSGRMRMVFNTDVVQIIDPKNPPTVQCSRCGGDGVQRKYIGSARVASFPACDEHMKVREMPPRPVPPHHDQHKLF